MARDTHNAAPSAVGYQHQTWWALVELLRSGPHRPDAAISLELFDDIAWEQAGTATELLQVKHHLGSSRALSDRSVDVWKTLQVWMDNALPENADGPALALVTTQHVLPGSAMAALRTTEDRDENVALGLLEAVAAEAGAKETEKARKRFLELSRPARSALIHRIRVADGSPRIDDVDAQARLALYWALPRGSAADLFLALVWKWWDKQALAMLQGRLPCLDLGTASAAITEIRDQFTNDRLPTIVHLDEVNDDVLEAQYRMRPFVEQMNWVAFPPRNLKKAIVDYYRAFTQAVRWVDEDLIGVGELENFELELRDEWERQFDWMLDELGEDADEDAKRDAGRQLLRNLLEQTGITVRAQYNDPFFARGQRHMLADDGRIGWHKDFESRIESLLSIHG